MDAENKKGILISCVDARLLDEMVDYMDKEGLNDKYYHLILAGCSLGYATGYENYIKGQILLINAVMNNNEPNTALHNQIGFIYIMEHYDCGAYKLHYNLGSNDPRELQYHKDNVNVLEKELRKWADEEANGKPKLKIGDIKSFIMSVPVPYKVSNL